MAERASNRRNPSDKIWHRAYTGNVETKDYLEIFYNRCASNGLSDKSLVAYGYHLGRFVRWLEKNGIRLENTTKQTIEKYSVDCQHHVFVSKIGKSKPRSISSVNDDLRLLRNFFGYICSEDNIHLWENGKLLKNPMVGIKLLKQKRQMKPVLSEEHITIILKSLHKKRKTFAGSRNFAIVYLLWDSAIRASELLNLKRSDFDSKRGTIRVTRKGGNEDTVAIGYGCKDAMMTFEKQWLSKLENGDGSFFSTRQGKRIQQRNLNHILTRIGMKVGLGWIGPHTFRRSSAQWMARNGESALSIRLKGGWSTMAMVDYYTREVSAEQMQEQHRKHSPGDSIKI